MSSTNPFTPEVHPKAMALSNITLGHPNQMYPELTGLFKTVNNAQNLPVLTLNVGGNPSVPDFFFTNLIIPEGFIYLGTNQVLTKDFVATIVISETLVGASNGLLVHTRSGHPVSGRTCVPCNLINSISAIRFKESSSSSNIYILALMPNLTWIYIKFISIEAADQFVTNVSNNNGNNWVEVNKPEWDENRRIFICDGPSSQNLNFHP